MAGERELTLRLPQLQEWVTDLYWEYDRMSASGQKTLNQLAKKVGVPTQDEMEADDE